MQKRCYGVAPGQSRNFKCYFEQSVHNADVKTDIAYSRKTVDGMKVKLNLIPDQKIVLKIRSKTLVLSL
jgi:hypothetical protein